ncbi:hypothetical protein TWF696_001269 [Orbilia brochopaga]|uniref:Tail specific protease domain-containing protein n=1 Tax=Orbilia brochopaga TaxID=3140254 RepID=A0AAV9UAI6_9PEZI
MHLGMRATAVLWLLGAANFAVAAPTSSYTNTTIPPSTHIPTPTAYTPSSAVFRTACAQVSASYASALASYSSVAATNTSAVAPTSVPVRPRELWDCLYSIPINVDLSIEFVKQVSKYLKFQSTIAYLAKPPEGSLQDPVDILGSLETLAKKVASGEIAHHIIFEYTIIKLLQRAHDGHLGLRFNSGALADWQGPFPLVSVSVDGVAKPKVYVQSDVRRLGTDAPYVTRIDGYEVQAWLAEWADFGSSQSPDARYNSVFARYDPPSDGSFYNLYTWYPGKNSISITFSNSSTYEYDFKAFATWTPAMNWTGINDGTDFYKKIVVNPNFFNETATTAVAAKRWEQPTPAPAVERVVEKLRKRANATTTSTLAPTSTGEPEKETPLVLYNAPFMKHRVGPYVQDLNQIFGGYFLNDTLQTAVIDISSFAAEDEEAAKQAEGFRAAVTAFFDEVRRRKSQKVIIDVRGNGGGLVDLGFELYKQLFPAAPAKSYYRIRAHGASQIYATASEKIATDENVEQLIQYAYSDGKNSTLSTEEVTTVFTELSRGFSRQNVLDVKGNKLKNLDSWIGGVLSPRVNDSVSAVVQTNLDLEFDSEISGFGLLKNFTETPQPFQIPDILLLSDGTCASTCTIFAELLKREQPGISTIVVGGRPNNAPSAHVGGTHGSRILYFSNLLDATNNVLATIPPDSVEKQRLYDLVLPYKLPLGISIGAINFRDAIRPEDETQTPLQFKLDPADCRLYYTETVFRDSINLWGELAELKWGTKSNFTGCAVGGLQKGQGSSGAVPDDPDAQNISDWVMQGLGGL